MIEQRKRGYSRGRARDIDDDLEVRVATAIDGVEISGMLIG